MGMLLMNGPSKQSFNLRVDTQQGSPLPPILFVLTAARLACLIMANEKTHRIRWGEEEEGSVSPHPKWLSIQMVPLYSWQIPGRALP